MSYRIVVVICVLQVLDLYAAFAYGGCPFNLMGMCIMVTNNVPAYKQSLLTNKVTTCKQKCGDTNSVSDSSKTRQYCLVDLSGGPSASEYPIKWEQKMPAGGWTDAHKTDWLVLRRVEPGTFVMGEDKTNALDTVTLTRPFYIGVFELTQRQWELVMGTRPAEFIDNYEKLPVESVSYEMIRGAKLGMKRHHVESVDDNSFFGRLRKKTGLIFDLPTEAQWEYACSAGGEQDREQGKSLKDDYMWYEDNSNDRTHEVGLKSPNVWGLFDMCGNVSEWCLDAYFPMPCRGVDPIGGGLPSMMRAARGGSYHMESELCTSWLRFYQVATNSFEYIGFRVSLRFSATP